MKQLLLVLFLIVSIKPVFADDPTFRTVQRAKTLSLGGLYLAGVDGANSLFNNTAGLVFINTPLIDFSLTDMIGQSSFTDTENTLFNSFQQDNVPLSIAVVYPITDNLVASIAYERNYAYNINWPFAVLSQTDSSSTLQTFDLYNNYNVDAIAAGLAYRSGIISFGATFDALQVSYESAFPITNSKWGDTLGLPAYQLQYDMSSWTFGFNAGVMLSVSENLRLGALVKSTFSADLDGNAESIYFSEIDSISSTSNVSTSFDYPWVFGMGVLYKPSTDMSINVDAQYSLFGSSKKSLVMNFSEQGWESNNWEIDPLVGVDPSDINLSFENTIDIAIGFEYSPSDWSFRGGYRFSQSQNSSTSYNYLYPTVDKNWLSVGLGYNDLTYFVDLAAAYAFGVSTNVMSYQNISGNYDSETVYVSATIKYVF